MKLNKYDIDCSKQTTRPVYEKRYKQNGEEYLKKVDEINIEEDLKEKSLEVNRIKEIFNNQERIKESQLIDEYTEETKLKELELMQNYKELDTYQFLNQTIEIQNLYNRMPEEIRKQYKDLTKFTKEYLPKFSKETYKRYEELKTRKTETMNNQKVEQTKEEIQNQINELTKKLEGADNV